jgi:hypothetical protein
MLDLRTPSSPHSLYVMVDDFCHSQPPKRRPGPQTSLSESEVLTLAIFARWSRFTSERDFYRYAQSHLRDAFPTLPDRSQFNRLVRDHLDLIEEVALHLAEVMGARKCSYQALDSSAMPVRDAKRRGTGWLAGYADIGWSNRLGWYEGFRLLSSRRSRGSHNGLRLRARFRHRPTGGRNPLRRAPSAESKAQERGVCLLGTLRSRQGLRRHRKS